MDSHDVGRGRGGIAVALGSLHQPALVVSVSSDWLYPPAEQEELVSLLPRAELARLESIHGHDGFLIEGEELNDLVKTFRNRQDSAEAFPEPPDSLPVRFVDALRVTPRPYFDSDQPFFEE